MAFKEPKITWVDGTPESSLVVEEFEKALATLRDNHPEIFVHFVRVCHDSDYAAPSKALKYLLDEGFLKEEEEGKSTPSSPTLGNVVRATTANQEDGKI